MAVYSEDCHCGQSEDSGGEHACVMLQWVYCVCSHETSWDCSTEKQVFCSKQTGDRVLTRDGEESENCFQTAVSLYKNPKLW